MYMKIVYVTPALYMAGGVERVLTLKANYFAEHFGYDITIVLTEGKGKPLFYPLSDKIRVVNLGIGFEELWTCPFVKKVFVYLKKQRRFKKLLTAELMRLRPDITVSMLRREINFINGIDDGSKKVGEMHVTRANYRNFEAYDSNFFKQIFSKFWMIQLVGKLKQLDRLIVLTNEDKAAWSELQNVVAIPDPLSFVPKQFSTQDVKRVIAVGRYAYEKGFDLLLKAWVAAEKMTKDWRLDIFGDGDRTPYEKLIDELGIDRSRCELHGRTNDVEHEYCQSSLFVLSSRFEGFGMVITEAMACGLPVVAFNCRCGPSSIITHDEDGLLVESGNVGALAQALVRLMSDEMSRRNFASAGMRNVMRYQIEDIAETWRRLFEEVVQKD